MKIGLITLSRIQANQNQYYNAQDLGLAKALSKKGNQIVIYRLTEDIQKCEKEGEIPIIYRKVSGIGKQSLCNFKFLDKELDCLICFSDNQISYPTLHKWSKRNQVLIKPYVGVLQSNSTKKMVQMITNAMVMRNIGLYRKITTYGKTPDIIRQLADRKVEHTRLVPVCLNEDLLKSDYETASKIRLREKYGFCAEDKVLFFMGRLEAEKEPVEMIEVLNRVRKQDKCFKLLMVGKGGLEQEVLQCIEQLNLENYVKRIPQISNKEVWELYCLSDCFVNLNRHEIYGMSILEALYYRCPVIAMVAPGPKFILNDGEIGVLCAKIEELEQKILNLEENKKTVDTKEYLKKYLSWDKVCENFVQEKNMLVNRT